MGKSGRKNSSFYYFFPSIFFNCKQNTRTPIIFSKPLHVVVVSLYETVHDLLRIDAHTIQFASQRRILGALCLIIPTMFLGAAKQALMVISAGVSSDTPLREVTAAIPNTNHFTPAVVLHTQFLSRLFAHVEVVAPKDIVGRWNSLFRPRVEQ